MRDMAAKKSNSLLDIQSKKKQRSIFHHCAFPLDCIASETVLIILIVHLVPELATQRDSQQNCMLPRETGNRQSFRRGCTGSRVWRERRGPRSSAAGGLDTTSSPASRNLHLEHNGERRGRYTKYVPYTLCPNISQPYSLFSAIKMRLCWLLAATTKMTFSRIS